VHVRVVVPDPPVTELGVLQVIPVGEALTVNVTVPENPFSGAIVMVVSQPFPTVHWVVVAVEGAIVKSGAGTVTVMVTS
jgi:hypothetical protein